MTQISCYMEIMLDTRLLNTNNIDKAQPSTKKHKSKDKT